MKRLLITLCVIGLVGCTTGTQRTGYNTIFSVEQTATTAVDGYYALVIKGVVTTNSVPMVSQRFNQLQMACTLAADATQAGTNALASATLMQEESDLINLVNALKLTTTITNK